LILNLGSLYEFKEIPDENTNYIIIKVIDYEYSEVRISTNFRAIFSLFYLCQMNIDYQIPEPFLFNPVKHHLGYIKEFINLKIDKPGLEIQGLTRDLKHIGTSVMDIYTGRLSIRKIYLETEEFLWKKDLLRIETYSKWTGLKINCFRINTLSDGSQWTLKYHDNPRRFIHIFPARNSQHTFRVKSNTLKSALIYIILIGKDLVTGKDLNNVRPLLGLSPVKDPIDTEAILEMIEILRD